MLLEVPQLPNKLKQMMSRPIEGMAAIQRAIDSVSHYLVLKTAISIVTGLVARGMLAALDVRFAFVWGLLAFALNYIPNIGSVLAAIPLLLRCWYLAAFTMRWWFWQAIWSSTRYSGISSSRGSWGVDLDCLRWWFLSLIFWGWLLGPVGMLLSVPLTIIVKIALEQTNGGQSIAVLLSDLNKE